MRETFKMESPQRKQRIITNKQHYKPKNFVKTDLQTKTTTNKFL